MIPTTKQIDKINNLLKLPVVAVTWCDAASGGGWNSVEEYRKSKGILESVSVGMLIANDKRHIQLVQSISENNTVADSIAIPKNMIKHVRVLAKGVQ